MRQHMSSNFVILQKIFEIFENEDYLKYFTFP